MKDDFCQFLNKKRYLFFIILLIVSCSKLNNQLIGNWEIYYMFDSNNQQIGSNLLSRSISLNSDNTCTLPYTNISDRNTEIERGKWEIINLNNKKYLKISSKNKIFNSTYLIKGIKEIQQGAGTLLGMTLVADDFRLECIKQPY